LRSASQVSLNRAERLANPLLNMLQQVDATHLEICNYLISVISDISDISDISIARDSDNSKSIHVHPKGVQSCKMLDQLGRFVRALQVWQKSWGVLFHLCRSNEWTSSTTAAFSLKIAQTHARRLAAAPIGSLNRF
jgi:hypothetical protein